MITFKKFCESQLFDPLHSAIMKIGRNLQQNPFGLNYAGTYAVAKAFNLDNTEIEALKKNNILVRSGVEWIIDKNRFDFILNQINS